MPVTSALRERGSGVWTHPRLHSEFEASQGYMRPKTTTPKNGATLIHCSLVVCHHGGLNGLASSVETSPLPLYPSVTPPIVTASVCPILSTACHYFVCFAYLCPSPFNIGSLWQQRPCALSPPPLWRPGSRLAQDLTGEHRIYPASLPWLIVAFQNVLASLAVRPVEKAEECVHILCSSYFKF